MKKKLAIISAVLALVLALTVALVACNAYKQASIGAGEPNAEVVSNGGYAVKQGKYLYYVNGYDGTESDNTFGTVTKQNILRSEVTVNADGKWEIDNTTTKVVVPKTVLYSSSVKDGGIAVFGEWIYYASPNYDKDKTGTASTTDVDFMRTKIDGTITQNIAKISGRDTRYLFTKNRILYVSGSSVNYIDFSGMKTNKSITKPGSSGVSTGTLAENISGTVLWSMDCDRIFFVQSVTGENSYKQYNELCSIKIDGSDKKTLATEGTFLEGEETPEDKVLKVFKYSLVNMLQEGDDVTLYYTKTHRNGSSDTSDGFFCAKASDLKGTEYLMTTQSVSAVTPLGYEEGALLTISSNLYKLDKNYSPNGASGEAELVKLNDRLIVNGTPAICYVDKEAEKIYYTSSSVTGLAYTSYNISKRDNQELVFSEGIKTDWLNLDFVGTNLFFFATDDENYVHFIDITEPIYEVKDDESGEQKKTPYVGLYREEDDEEEE